MNESGQASAMRLSAPGLPLEAVRVAAPAPGPGQVAIRVLACGVCRTDVHVADGDLPHPRLPLIPGHEVVGVVEGLGANVSDLESGDRVGVPWLGWTCGECRWCLSGRENLCREALFTGYTVDGGYARRMVAHASHCFRLPEQLEPAHAAPLLCAGLIGHRSLRMAGEPERLGLYGFGASAHIVIQVARHRGARVFAFTRAGDVVAQEHARALGAEWAGAAGELPPDPLDAAIIFAPAGHLVPQALAATEPGGRVICAGIHMSAIPSFPYSLLWEERRVQSVANLTRADGELLELATRIPIQTDVETFPLEEANRALASVREGRVRGAAVLVM